MKHLRVLRTYAAGLGLREARIEQGGKHPHLVGLSGQPARYVLASTPSDSIRGEANAKADLKRLLGRAKPEKGVLKVMGLRRVRRRLRPLRSRLLPTSPVEPAQPVPERGVEVLGPLFDKLPLTEQFNLLVERD
jgi:hypothetical protein